MTPDLPGARRRHLLFVLATGAVVLGAPGAVRAAGLPPMTEGPFYPPADWRARQLDWDADLTRVDRAGAGTPARAGGEWLDLGGQVVDARGRAVDGAVVEIWQCDVFGSYRHPRGAGSRVDEAFQGYGATRSDVQGRYRFRTIRPTPYPGRTPHIHVRLRHPAWGELTSQLFVAGDPGNARDFLYRQLSAADRAAAEMTLQRAGAGDAVVWTAERALVVGG